MAHEARLSGAVATSAPTRGTFRSALSHRQFRLLLGSNLGSQLATWSQNIGLGSLAYGLTHSAFQVSLVFFVTGTGMLFGAIVGGTLADRVDRRRILVTTQMGMITGSALLSALVVAGNVHLWQVYILAFSVQFAFAISGPARQAMVYDIVGKDNLVQAVSINSVSQNCMRAIGPALAGILINTVGIGGTFVMQTCGFTVSLMVAVMLKSPGPPASRTRLPLIASVREGVRYARRMPKLTTMLWIAVLFSVLGMAYMPLMPAYADKVLGLSRGGYGLIMAVNGAGAIVGAGAVTAVGDSERRGVILILAAFVTGLFILAVGFFTSLGAANFSLAILGFASTIIMGICAILVQMLSNDEYRGRVTSLYFLTFGLQPIGNLPAGALTRVIGLEHTLAIMGGLMMAIIIWIAATSPHFRRV